MGTSVYWMFMWPLAMISLSAFVHCFIQLPSSSVLDDRLLLALESNQQVGLPQVYSCNFHLTLFLSRAVCFFLVMIHFRYTGNDVILQTFATMTVIRTAIIMWPTKFKHHVYYRALPNISLQPLIFSPRLAQTFQPLGPLVVVFFCVLKE